MGRRSSTRRTSIGWPRARCASTVTTPVRCRACRRATTSCAGRSTSCGGRGARSRCGRTPITHHLRLAGVTTMLVSDHPHLFETGGENYHTDFGGWEYVRGHEGDPWRTAPDPSWIGAPALPGPRRVDPPPLRHDAHVVPRRDRLPGRPDDVAGGRVARPPGAGRRALLPVRRRVRSARAVRRARAVDVALRPRLVGPEGDLAAVRRRRRRRSGVIDERTAAHVRANYGAKLTLHRPLARHACSTRSTARTCGTTRRVIVCTDHGHYLGERDVFGKPDVPVYEPLGHLPLFVAWPGVAPGHVDALTTTVDLFATLGEVFGVSPEHRTPRHVARPADRRPRRPRPRVGADRRVGPQHPDRRRPAPLRPSAGRRQPAAVDVVEPLVDDAGPRLPEAAPAAARPARRARPGARLGRARHPPAVRRRRPGAVLGLPARHPSPRAVRPRRRPVRDPRPRRLAAPRPRWPTCCAPRSTSWRRPATSSNASPSDHVAPAGRAVRSLTRVSDRG